MQCPFLNDLPPAPRGLTGWPWTEESRRVPKRTVAMNPCPKITVITPSFNQGLFVEATIRSVLLQGYPDLEYLVLDGGSTDGSVDIIKKYSRWIDYWISEPDGGQSKAINRGLKMGSGQFATWINSDDLLCKNAIADCAAQMEIACLRTVYVGIAIYIDVNGSVLRSHQGRVHSLDDLVRVRTVWHSGGHIVQPEVLFPRELAVAVGGLDPDNHRTMDYELWGKFFLAGAQFRYTKIPFGMFRAHPDQKTYDGLRQTRSLLDTARKLVIESSSFSGERRDEILADLRAYGAAHEDAHYKASGRMARLGLPREVVIWLRRLKALLKRAPLAASRE